MSEDTKAAVRRFFEEFFNPGDLSRIDEFVDPNYVDHNPMPGLPANREGLKQVMTMVRQAFSDLHEEIEDIVAEGDRAAVRNTMHANHTGEFMGIAPTGKPIAVSGIAILRFVGDRVAERWEYYDEAGMMRQLGVSGTG